MAAYRVTNEGEIVVGIGTRVRLGIGGLILLLLEPY